MSNPVNNNPPQAMIASSALTQRAEAHRLPRSRGRAASAGPSARDAEAARTEAADAEGAAAATIPPAGQSLVNTAGSGTHTAAALLAASAAMLPKTKGPNSRARQLLPRKFTVTFPTAAVKMHSLVPGPHQLAVTVNGAADERFPPWSGTLVAHKDSLRSTCSNVFRTLTKEGMLHQGCCLREDGILVVVMGKGTKRVSPVKLATVKPPIKTRRRSSSQPSVAVAAAPLHNHKLRVRIPGGSGLAGKRQISSPRPLHAAGQSPGRDSGDESPSFSPTSNSAGAEGSAQTDASPTAADEQDPAVHAHATCEGTAVERHGGGKGLLRGVERAEPEVSSGGVCASPNSRHVASRAPQSRVRLLSSPGFPNDAFQLGAAAGVAAGAHAVAVTKIVGQVTAMHRTASKAGEEPNSLLPTADTLELAEAKPSVRVTLMPKPTATRSGQATLLLPQPKAQQPRQALTAGPAICTPENPVVAVVGAGTVEEPRDPQCALNSGPPQQSAVVSGAVSVGVAGQIKLPNAPNKNASPREKRRTLIKAFSKLASQLPLSPQAKTAGMAKLSNLNPEGVSVFFRDFYKDIRRNCLDSNRVAVHEILKRVMESKALQ